MTTIFSVKPKVAIKEIPYSKWGELRDLYKRDWPNYVTTYNTLRNYIKWMRQPEYGLKIKIKTIDDGNQWKKHGTFVLEDKKKSQYNIYFNTLEPDNPQLLLGLLNHFDSVPEYTLTAYLEPVRLIVEAHLRQHGPLDFNTGYCSTILYHLPTTACQQLTAKPVQGFKVKPLTAGNVAEINNLWPFPNYGFKSFLRRIIRWNLTFGAFDESDNKLIAWVVQLPVGTIGLFQTDIPYQRTDLSEYLVTLISLSIAQNGCDATVTLGDSNIATRALFEKLGFMAVDRCYWFDKTKPHLDGGDYGYFCESLIDDDTLNGQLNAEMCNE